MAKAYKQAVASTEAHRAAMSRVVKDLLVTNPWPGFWLTVFHILGVWSLVALSAYVVRDWPLFLLVSAANGILYTSVMSTTHDAAHNTLTGWRWFDEFVPRAFSYAIFWPHGIYSELHKLHHKMNGRDLRDPERPTPTAEEVATQGPLGKFYYRHQWFLNLFVFGGIGMVVKHIWAAWKLRHASRKFKRLFLTDGIGISVCISLTIAIIVYFDVFWQYVACFFIMERIIGFAQQLRSHTEHYGIWHPGDHQLATKFLNCRNIRTNFWGRRLFNNLAFHSVHHAFPAIPFYHLPKAHERLSTLFVDETTPLAEDRSYLKTAWRLARRPQQIVTVNAN